MELTHSVSVIRAEGAAIIPAVIVVPLMLLSPTFILNLAGPAGFGLMAMTMGNSSEYQSLMRAEEYFSGRWEAVEEVVLWRKRHVIGLWLSVYTEEGVKQAAYRTFSFYCKKGEEDKCVAFIKSKTQEVPYAKKALFLHEGMYR